MFETLDRQPTDPLLALIAQFRDDPRSDKIDLGVGVYRDAAGATPVFRAVKAAERRLLDGQPSKSYLGPEGDLRFVELLAPVVLGQAGYDPVRVAGLQTPGGCGALRLAAELIAVTRPRGRIWISRPTWPNHAPIFQAAGLEVVQHPYFDIARQELFFDDMMDALDRAEPGDAVLLHGCCHNPTGADLDDGQWGLIGSLLARRGLLPLVDFAYQGLGQSLEKDARGVRQVLSAVEEALVAYSCDKNFGLYRDRVGALFVQTRGPDATQAALSHLAAFARASWSMPPDHGAAAVRMILDDADLAASWREELDGMGQRIRGVRAALAEADPDLGFVARQNGLFSNLPLAQDKIARLRAEHGIYMAGSGRINVAGLQAADAPRLARALRAVGGLDRSGAHAHDVDRLRRS